MASRFETPFVRAQRIVFALLCLLTLLNFAPLSAAAAAESVAPITQRVPAAYGDAKDEASLSHLRARKLDFENLAKKQAAIDAHQEKDLRELKAQQDRQLERERKAREIFLMERAKIKVADDVLIEKRLAELDEQKEQMIEKARVLYVDRRDKNERMALQPPYWIDPALEYDLHDPNIWITDDGGKK